MSKLNKLVSLLAVLVMVCGFSLAGEAAQKKVAVMPFENVSGSAEHKIAEIMTEHVMVTLHNSGLYTVVERTQLAQSIKEINLQNTGMMDRNQAIQLGRMTGADYTIVGKVLMANVVDNEISVISGGVLGGWNPYGAARWIPKYKGLVSLDLRFVDNATGEVVLAELIEGSKSGHDRSASLNAACKEAAGNILTVIRKNNPFIATVLDADDGVVIINKGFGTGVRKGDVLVAYRESGVVKGLDGEIVTTKIKMVGKVM